MTEAGNTAKKIIIHADIDLKDLIPGFLENRRKDIIEIGKMLLANDHKGIERIGHSIKGSGGGYGFEEITNIGMRIERAAKEQAPVEITMQLGALSRYLDCIEVVFD
jgi:HPt (histidine-containing phosphotransfer) domain-containing protein